MQQFLEMLPKVPADNSCMIWPFAKDSFGYGQITHQGNRFSTHVLAYELSRGIDRVERGMTVRHDCDIPSCFRPDHLQIGTQSDNMRDAFLRKRFKSGETHPFATLSDEQVESIRRRWWSDPSPTVQKSIAYGAEYSVSRWTIAKLVYFDSRWPTGEPWPDYAKKSH